MRRFLHRRFLHNEEGSVVLLAVFMLPVLLGITAFAIDLSNLYYNKSAIQRAADAAAIGGVLVLPDAMKAKSQALALVGANTPANFGTISLDQDIVPGVWDPVAHTFTASMTSPDALQVTTYRSVGRNNPVLTYFAGILGVSSMEVTGKAIAVRFGGACVRVLNPTASSAFQTGGSGNVTINCGLQINSSAANAADRKGSSQITSTNTCITGGTNTTSGWTPAPRTGCTAGVDVLAYLAEPAQPAATCAPPPSSGTLTGNCTYTGKITLGGNVTLGSGIYYLKNATMSVANNAVINGSGVTIFVDAGSSLSLSGNATVKLSAPTSGSYAGILVFQSRSTPSSTTMSLNGDGNMQLNGTLYAPTIMLSLGGNSTLATKTGSVVADQLSVKGSGGLIMNAFNTIGTNPRSLAVHTGLVY